MVFESFMAFMHKILLFSSFVNTANGFPKPLSAEEEKKHFERFRKHGDPKSKDVLISHNLRLVAHIVKKYSGAGEADDLISVGSIGLIKAINTFEYGKGTQLSTYAARCIENEILMLIRMSKKHKQVVSLNEYLSDEKDGGEMELGEIVGCEKEDLMQQVENNIVNEKLMRIVKDSLTEREYSIICMRYGLESTSALTQREVADKLGISRSYISRLETKALEIIQKEVKKNKLFE